jgi:hypothetical protein
MSSANAILDLQWKDFIESKIKVGKIETKAKGKNK